MDTAITAFLISNDNSTRYERSDLADGFAESWLQKLLLREPDLVPLADIDPSAGRFIPVCRELTLPRVGGSVHLDVFGVTPTGRPVLIECKLWRNPQARREVIAQVLEYAAILRKWSYADLTAHLKAKLAWSGDNPLFAHAQANGSPLNETVFTDAVACNLRNGDFHLVVAGDGIREDARAIAEHIGDKGARLAVQGSGDDPRVPARVKRFGDASRAILDGLDESLVILFVALRDLLGFACPPLALPDSVTDRGCGRGASGLLQILLFVREGLRQTYSLASDAKKLS